jgi:3-methyl-2-oxobutanoate hydroxymethyltransferase
MAKWTPARLRALKQEKKRFASVTVHDLTSAWIAESAGLPMVLVGDSLGNTVLGFDTTLPVTLDMMLHHTAAASRGTKTALLVADLPFMTYQVSSEQALISSGRLLAEGNADAVKLEGGSFRAETVSRLVQNGIPVLGHIGLTPQSEKVLGRKIQGKTQAAAKQLLEDAKALEEAGAFGIVLEACPQQLAREITERVSIPTIGIGAGPECDGQILVFHDLLGLYPHPSPSFVKLYAQLGQTAAEALRQYAEDVEQGTFPGPEHSFS